MKSESNISIKTVCGFVKNLKAYLNFNPRVTQILLIVINIWAPGRCPTEVFDLDCLVGPGHSKISLSNSYSRARVVFKHQVCCYCCDKSKDYVTPVKTITNKINSNTPTIHAYFLTPLCQILYKL